MSPELNSGLRAAAGLLPAGGFAYLSGLLLGLSMILPIGPQNIFVLSQGLSGDIRRALLAAVVAGLCDTVLILVGAAGLSALLLAAPALKAGLLALGALFLLYLGWTSLRRTLRGSASAPIAPAATGHSDAGAPPLAATPTSHQGWTGIVGTAVAVSWGNPHAVLDTVAVLGSAIASREAASRLAFAAGAVSASWLFFLMLAAAGATLGQKVGAGGRLWMERVSGSLMLLFGLGMGWQAALALAALLPF